MLIYTCPACGREIKLPADRLGTVVVCPHCLDKAAVSDDRVRAMGQPAPARTPQPAARPQQVEPYSVDTTEREIDTTAILALTLGVASLLSPLCCFMVLAGPVAAIAGFISHGRINANPRQLTGKRMATIGIVLGATGALIMILLHLLLAFGVVKGRLGR